MVYVGISRSIPVGDELLQEFMMFSLGVPLSKKSLPSYLSTVEKRMRKILQGIPEFLELTEDVQREIEATNLPEATAMIIARCEISTGAELV